LTRFAQWTRAHRLSSGEKSISSRDYPIMPI
jgi:hypothetical protein